MDLVKILFLIVMPALLLCSLIEAVVLSRRGGYDWRAMGVSLSNLAARQLLNFVLPLTLATPVINWAWEHRIHTVALDSVGLVFLLFLAQDFCYYWYHRAAHRVRWFWANHAVHHSSNNLNFSAAYRLGTMGRLTGNLIFFVPVVWIGFSPKLVAATVAINLFYQFWIHSTWIPKLGWLEYILNTPSAHRVHHAANVEYLDANYGGVLIIFDRLFGTYIPERADLPCRYGLVTPQLSYNPLRVEFDEWCALGRDLLAARSVRAFLGHLFLAPGWRADGTGLTTAALRAQAAALAQSSAAPLAATPAATPGVTPAGTSLA